MTLPSNRVGQSTNRRTLAILARTLAQALFIAMATEARIALAPVKAAMKVTVAQAIRVSLTVTVTAIVMAKATNPMGLATATTTVDQATAMDLSTATTTVDQATAMVAMEAARANPAQATAM